MLKPRVKRYEKGTDPLPMGNPVNAVIGKYLKNFIYFKNFSVFLIKFEIYRIESQKLFVLIEKQVLSPYGGVGWDLIVAQLLELIIINGNSQKELQSRHSTDQSLEDS
jgi:hypothetical protein